MAPHEQKSIQEQQNRLDEGHDEDAESTADSCSDDLDEDPSFDIVEETRESLSRMSLKKTRSRISKKKGMEGEETESAEFEILELDEMDKKSFEMVEKLIKDGQLGKLKVDQCKVYLRKYGLRLTGNKGVLIARIGEHLEVLDGGGEKKYPISSFVMNCKGDACTGDVVMFEQTVYEMYSIASRSATGPPLGTRTVAGRIVKESYGSAKQQHTFTIEVLWSKGERPFPPLRPLLIKGRNLYKLKTVRQRWIDEDERRNVLQEKHTRGSLARCSRENRIQDKEMRMTGGIRRMKENVNNRIPPNQGNSKVNRHRANAIRHQNMQRNQELPQSTVQNKSNGLIQENTQHNHHSESNSLRNQEIMNYKGPSIYEHQKIRDNVTRSQSCTTSQASMNITTAPKLQNSEPITQKGILPHFHEVHKQARHPLSALNYSCKSVHPQFHAESECYVSQILKPRCYRPQSPKPHHYHQGQQFLSCSSTRWSPRPQHYSQQQQLCPYYWQRRCYFGEQCKYLHN